MNIVGAGIIGVTCAIRLRQQGFDVSVVDPGLPQNAASYGNAGGLAFSELIPMASIGMLLKVPGWLFDPLGPISIRAGSLPQLLPWFWRLLRACGDRYVRQSIIALAALNKLSEKLTVDLYGAAGIQHHLRPTGALHLYESEQEFRRAQPNWQARSDYGIKFHHISREALLELEPGLSTHFYKATFIEDWLMISDPEKITLAFAEYARSLGVKFITGHVVDIELGGQEVNILLKDGRRFNSQYLVLAAGAWTSQLSRKLGDELSLIAERGYNTTLTNAGVEIERELIFGEHGFVASPLACGLRIGGAAEFANVSDKANFKRSEAMLKKAVKFIPELNITEGTQWMGPRPTTPDTVPVIGHSNCDKRILYAVGHGHLGLTQAPGTAALVADLLLGHSPAIDVSPYRANRF